MYHRTKKHRTSQIVTRRNGTAVIDDHGKLVEESHQCLRYAVKPP
jgi:hypothetical protein